MLRPSERIAAEWLSLMRIIVGFFLLYEHYQIFRNDFHELRFLSSMTRVPGEASTSSGSYMRFEYFLTPKWWGPPSLDHFIMAWLCSVLLNFSAITGLLSRTTLLLCTLFLFFVESLDASHYDSYRYLLCILGVTLAAMPIGETLSIDSMWFARRAEGTLKRAQAPSRAARITVARWNWTVLRLLLGIVYLYAGLWKVNEDWFIRGEPLHHWFVARLNKVPEAFHGVLADPLFAIAGSQASACYELLAALVLFLPQRWCPRWIRFLLVVGTIGFHASNKFMFGLGALPVFFSCLSVLFWEPAAQKGDVLSPRSSLGLGFVLGLFWLFIHAVIPMRSLSYGASMYEPVLWHQEGYEFSWRFRLGAVHGGSTTNVSAIDPATGSIEPVALGRYVHPTQWTKVGCNPVLLHQLAYFISQDKNVSDIRVQAVCDVNFREPQRLINQAMNLLETPLWEFPLPFTRKFYFANRLPKNKPVIPWW